MVDYRVHGKSEEGVNIQGDPLSNIPLPPAPGGIRPCKSSDLA